MLFWVTQGKRNGAVGTMLGMREGTVRTHLEHIYTRLGVEHRHAATYRVLEVLGLPETSGVVSPMSSAIHQDWTSESGGSE